MNNTLLIGIGNKGRGDDGLGWTFVDQFAGECKFDVVYRYQLQVEDAELISHYTQVWFIDASYRDYVDGFNPEIVNEIGMVSYSSHKLEPSAVVSLCHQIFHCFPQSFVIAITGTCFDLGTGITDTGRKNLNAALRYFESTVMNGTST